MARKKQQPATPPDQSKAEPAKTAPKLPVADGKSNPPPAETGNDDVSAGTKADQTQTADQPPELNGDAQAEPERSPGDQTADIENNETDSAVDDIAAKEADTMLAVQDALNRKHSQPSEEQTWKDKLRRLLKSRWTWITIFIILLVLFIVPTTRYKLLGLAVKKNVKITVMDSRTHTPVSAAEVSVHGSTAKTNSDGVAQFKATPGSAKLVIHKRYYKTYDRPLFVGLSKGAQAKVGFEATGRQVPIVVRNKITGQPIANAEIKALKTSAKTDKHGKAFIVLPAADTKTTGAVNRDGYNPAEVTIQITDRPSAANTFDVTPAGRVYFLSNLAGKMNVVKANLDGTDRRVVLESTGQEDSTTMTLLATRDWRYLALKARRDTPQPVLYLIDTKDDKVAPFDTNSGAFNSIGWYDHNFMYDFVSAAVPQSQNGHEVLKSYDAEHQQPNQLDQSQADASGYQDFLNFHVLKNQLVYNTQWHASGGSLDGKNASIRGVQPDGRSKKDYQTFPSAGLTRISAALYQPQAVYFAAYNNSTATTYYNFAADTVNAVSLDQSYFKKSYPTYLISPSGDHTLWSDQDAIFVGDKNAQHPKQLAGLDGYKSYGWYTDNYILLSKNDTDLYITSADGLRPGRQPLRIGYYYKPVQNFPNYGYGYGGQ